MKIYLKRKRKIITRKIKEGKRRTTKIIKRKRGRRKKKTRIGKIKKSRTANYKY